MNSQYYLKTQAYARTEVDQGLAGRSLSRGMTASLGTSTENAAGTTASTTFYRYDQCGARRMMAHADAPCRINTYVDLLEAHTADLARSNMDLEDYLLRYFIGHYNPPGNGFAAFATKDRLVEMLEPKPNPYQGVPASQAVV